jgi:putative endonuclease
MYYYVYILKSINYPNRYYVGYTIDLESRLKKHNEGGSPYTSKYKPWKVKNVIIFDDMEKAKKFEKYLKSHSGRAFAKKHF